MSTELTAPAELTVETFEYAEHPDGPLHVDVHSPASDGRTDRGTVVYLHGGGFAVGDRAMNRERVRGLAAHGLTVAVPDYRLAPGAAFPDQVDDVRATIRWIREHLDLIGTTNSRVALWGASAGAVLAGLAALTDTSAIDGDARGDVGVQAVVSWFGFSDIATSASRSPLEAHILPPGPENALLGVEDLSQAAELVRQASPLSHVRGDAPPFLIAHGDRDHAVDPSESHQLHQALTRAGASSTLMIVGGAGHEDPRFDAPDNLALTAAFLRSHLHDH